MTEVATRRPTQVGALTLDPTQAFWTPEQNAALASIGLAETPNADKAAFLHLCQATGLDPFRREIYLIGRNDRNSPGGKKWTAQTGIDGYRHLAEETGLYGGRVSQEWCGPDGVWQGVWLGGADNPPAAARVCIRRTDLEHPVYGIAVYSEFVPMEDVWEGTGQSRKRTGEKKPGGLWGKMPGNQLAKCAEAQAIRAAFPRQTAGVYVDAEMDQADAASRVLSATEAGEARAAARRAGIEVAGTHLGSRTRVDVGGPPLVVVDGKTGQVVHDESRPDGDPGPDDPDGQPTEGAEEARQAEPPTRDDLLAELAEQAKVHGVTVAAFCRRWVRAHKKNVEDATEEELSALVDSRRGITDEARAQSEAEQAPDQSAGDAPPADAAAKPDAEQVPVGDHRYAEDHDAKDGTCRVCHGEYDDRRHGIPGPDDSADPAGDDDEGDEGDLLPDDL